VPGQGTGVLPRNLVDGKHEETVDRQQMLLNGSKDAVQQFERRLVAAGLQPDAAIDQLEERRQALSAEARLTSVRRA
jgi:hypothetical protein